MNNYLIFIIFHNHIFITYCISIIVSIYKYHMKAWNQNENNTAQFAEYSHLSPNVENSKLVSDRREMTSIQSSGEYVSKNYSPSPKNKTGGCNNTTINTAFNDTSNFGGSPNKRHNPFNVAKQRSNIVDNSSGSKDRSTSNNRQMHTNHMVQHTQQKEN